MKIRKAHITSSQQKTYNVYLHENKKEYKTLVAVPDIEWSISIAYEDEKRQLEQSLEHSLMERVETDEASELAQKIVHWVTEM
ncbi:YueH family protein [Bacillus sp. FJAT-53060]|uniref:YueH family protein n=1 Tax=Bacillus TaxID=1386 RepID=UPI001CFA23BD|nr:YueH family protein [Bacillus stratosphericus]